MVHVLLALIFMNESESGLGRYKLQKMLVLSEGKVKTMLERMKKIDLIKKDTRVTGHILTPFGMEIIKEMYSKMSPPRKPLFDYSQIAVGKYAYYCIAKKSSDMISSGIDQRDDAIRIGGSGATCLIFKSNKFKFPDSDAECSFQTPPESLEFQIEDGDVLVIGTGSAQALARLTTAYVTMKIVGFEI